jgi:hypothetical protein
MGGDVLVGAIIVVAVLSLIAILRRERHDRDAGIEVQRPLYVTLAVVLILGLSLWLAGSAVITALVEQRG